MRRCEIISCQSSGKVRTETLLDKEYLVVPVVMLIGDIVVYGVNSKCPELVPSDVLADSCIDCWNTRPVVSPHPFKNNEYVSANTPDIYDEWCFGLIFNTTYDFNTKELKCEAWIDKDRANKLDGDPKKAYDLLSSGESIDVSVGVFLSTISISGTLNGSEYGAIWTSIDADHLALLPSNVGACNQEMGCGAGLKTLESKEEVFNMKTKSMLGRFLSYLRTEQTFDDGQSDQELRELLSKELKKAVPGFDWIVVLYLDNLVVIYSTFISNGYSWDGVYQFWRRTYTLSADKKTVILNNDALEVVAKEVWETVGGDSISESGEVTVASKKEEEENVNIDDNNVITPVTETPAPCACSKAENNLETTPETTTPETEIVVNPFEARMKAMQEEITTQKRTIISSLSGKTTFEDEELEAMSLSQLEKIRTMAFAKPLPIDHSIKPIPQPSNVSVLRQRPLPQTWKVGKENN